MGSRHCSEDWNGFPESRVVTSRKKHSQPWASVSRLRAAMTLGWQPLFAGWGWELGWARVQRPRCGPGHGARQWQGLAVRHGKLRAAGLGTPACAAALLTAWVWTAQNWNCPKNVIKSHCQNHTTAFPHTPLLFFFLCYQRSLWARMKQIFAALLISGPTQKDRGGVRAPWHADLLKQRDDCSERSCFIVPLYNHNTWVSQLYVLIALSKKCDSVIFTK